MEPGAAILMAILVGLIGFVSGRVLEGYKYQDQLRLKSEMMAELLAEIQGGSTEVIKLNKLRYQAFLWLPDSLAKDLSQFSSGEGEAKTLAAVLIAVRTHLRGDTELKASDIQSYYDKHSISLRNGIASGRHE